MNKGVLNLKRLALASSALVLLAGQANPALAQDAAAAEPEMADDIVVTARKRAETLVDVPVAITAVGAAEVARYAATDLSRIGQLVPQVIIARSSGAGSGASFIIRGVGSSQGDTGIEQTVTLNLDGVQLSRGRAIGQGFFDVRQVEVLKGPQALFFGKNSPGGVISVTSAGPTDEFEGFVRGGYEFRTDERFLEGAVSGPVTDTLGMRLALRGSDSEGYIRNLARPGVASPFFPGVAMPGAINTRQSATNELMGRLTVAYTPVDNFDATLKVFGAKRNENGLALAENIGCVDKPKVLGVTDPTGDCKLDGRRSVSALPEELAQNVPRAGNGEMYSKNKFLLTSLTANYQVSDITITSVTGYYDYKFTALDEFSFSAPGGLWTTFAEKYRSFSQELRAVTDFDSPINFAFGGLYETVKRRNDVANMQLNRPVDPVSGNRLISENLVHNKGETLSFFGQAILDITETVELAGGVRWTQEDKSTRMQNNYVHPTANLVNPLNRRPQGLWLNSDYKDENWSPEVTLSWHPTDRSTLYVAYKTGYKSGGFSTPQGGIPGSWNELTPVFGAETAEGAEIGAKAELFDRAVKLNLALYRYTFDDLQQTSFNAVTFLYSIRNAAKARTSGVELDGSWRVSPYVSLRGSVAYNRAKYLNFPLSPCWTGQSAAQGCSGGVQDLSGEALARAPRWNLAGGVSYDLPVGSGLMIGLTADANYTSGYWLQETQNPSAWQKGFARIDASARLYDEDEKWELALIGRNLTNKWYATASTDKPLGAVGEVSAATGRPREVLLQFMHRF